MMTLRVVSVGNYLLCMTALAITDSCQVSMASHAFESIKQAASSMVIIAALRHTFFAHAMQVMTTTGQLQCEIPNANLHHFKGRFQFLAENSSK